MPRPRDIEPVEVGFLGEAFEVPVSHFTWCFDLFLFGLAPVMARLGPAREGAAVFGGYAAVAGKEKEYYPEHEVVHFLESHGLDRKTAIELLVEVNGRNMCRVV